VICYVSHIVCASGQEDFHPKFLIFIILFIGQNDFIVF